MVAAAYLRTARATPGVGKLACTLSSGKSGGEERGVRGGLERVRRGMAGNCRVKTVLWYLQQPALIPIVDLRSPPPTYTRRSCGGAALC